MNALTKFWQGIFHEKKKEPHPNLQRRISRLFQIKSAEKEFSPTLQVLFTGKNKVRRLKTVYEGNLNDDYNESLETSITRAKSFSDRLHLIHKSLEEKLEDEGNQSVVDTFDESNASKEENKRVISLLEFLIESDDAYIDYMSQLIEFYVSGFKNLPLFRLKNDVEIMKLQKRELFGTIEEIYKFHVEVFRPMLLASAGNVASFARNLSELCSGRDFNCYIVYAMDEAVTIINFQILLFLITLDFSELQETPSNLCRLPQRNLQQMSCSLHFPSYSATRKVSHYHTIRTERPRI